MPLSRFYPADCPTGGQPAASATTGHHGRRYPAGEPQEARCDDADRSPIALRHARHPRHAPRGDGGRGQGRRDRRQAGHRTLREREPSPWRQRAGPSGTPRSRSTSSAWPRRSSRPTRGRSGSTRTRAWSVRHARPPTSASTPRRTSGRILWIRHLTRDRGVNLAGVRTLFELEERLGKRILEALYDEGTRDGAASRHNGRTAGSTGSRAGRRFGPHPMSLPRHRRPEPNRRRPQRPATQGDPDGQATVQPGGGDAAHARHAGDP